MNKTCWLIFYMISRSCQKVHFSGAIPNFATEKEQKRNFLDFNFFFIDPTPKLSCLALGNPSDQQHCTIAHISIAPPLFEVYNGFESWFASLSSLFDIWPCSLARSCRRCWCRSAAREGEPRGRQSSCRTALQRCWPALCCAPRNKRLAGNLMWCYN